MLLINLFGAPGAGKSTGAAYIFSKLKMLDYNAELVTEFVKDKVWEESKEVFKDQMYIFGKQHFRINRVKDKVDIVVTDSPLLLSVIYNDDPILGKEFNTLVKKVFSSYKSLNFFIERGKKYNPVGRNENEEESDELSIKIKKMLEEDNIPYYTVEGTLQGYDFILNLIEVYTTNQGVN